MDDKYKLEIDGLKVEFMNVVTLVHRIQRRALEENDIDVFKSATFVANNLANGYTDLLWALQPEEDD